MVVQLLRGKQSRIYERKLYSELLPGIIDQTKIKFGPLSEDQNRLLHAFESDEFFFKRTAMNVALDPDRIEKYSRILCGHDFLFYRIQGDTEFITSDNPVMLIDRITNNARPFANGLVRPNTLIYYPISPRILLCAVHPSAFWGALSDQDCHLIDLDACKENSFISFVNRKQIEQCCQHAFARSVSVLQ